jgi:hypothetical protein
MRTFRLLRKIIKTANIECAGVPVVSARTTFEYFPAIAVCFTFLGKTLAVISAFIAVMKCFHAISAVIAGESFTGRVRRAAFAPCGLVSRAAGRRFVAGSLGLTVVLEARVLVDSAIGIAQTIATGPDPRLAVMAARRLVAGIVRAHIAVIAGFVGASHTNAGITLIVLRACLAVFA